MNRRGALRVSRIVQVIAGLGAAAALFVTGWMIVEGNWLSAVSSATAGVAMVLVILSQQLLRRLV